MLMGRTNLLVQGKNVLFQLRNVSGKIQGTLKSVRLKQEVAPEKSLLRVLRTTTIICDKSSGSTAGY